MKSQWTQIAGVIALLLVAGCETAGGSNSGNSGSGNSNSGDSGSGHSQSNSGQSGSSQSEGSKASSETSGDSLKTSEGTTDNSVDSSRNSSENSKSSDSKSSQNSSGPVLSVTTLGATVGGLGLLIWNAVHVVPAAAAPAAPAEVGQAAQVYLRARTHQLREDLALGAGPTIEDLAAMARIRRENLRTFGRLLCAHRAELLALADSSALTPERARAWLERVGQIARTDPRLEEDRRAFLAAYGVVE